jgi:hypothetical protein
MRGILEVSTISFTIFTVKGATVQPVLPLWNQLIPIALTTHDRSNAEHALLRLVGTVIGKRAEQDNYPPISLARKTNHKRFSIFLGRVTPSLR